MAPYALGRLRGRDVAAIGTMPGPDTPAAWVTEVRTDDLAATVAAVRDAGGEVLQEEVDFSPVGKLAVFVDPLGATFCAWEAGDREGAQVVNEPSAWSMSALRTDDTERAVRFYGSVFGWEPEAFGPATMFRLPGYVGGEEAQPVPRDVVAVMMPADDDGPDRVGGGLLDRRRRARGRRRAPARRLGARRTVRRTAVVPSGRGDRPGRSALLAQPADGRLRPRTDGGTSIPSARSGAGRGSPQTGASGHDSGPGGPGDVVGSVLGPVVGDPQRPVLDRQRQHQRGGQLGPGRPAHLRDPARQEVVGDRGRARAPCRR